MKPAFGLFDDRMIPKINRLLKPYDLKLKVKSNRRKWGDQVEVTVEHVCVEPKELVAGQFIERNRV